MAIHVYGGYVHYHVVGVRVKFILDYIDVYYSGVLILFMFR